MDTTTGSLKVGGGSSTRPASQVFPTHKEAARALNRIHYDRDNIQIITYTKAPQNHA